MNWGPELFLRGCGWSRHAGLETGEPKLGLPTGLEACATVVAWFMAPKYIQFWTSLLSMNRGVEWAVCGRIWLATVCRLAIGDTADQAVCATAQDTAGFTVSMQIQAPLL